MTTQELKDSAKSLLAKIAETNTTLLVVLDNVFPIVEVAKDGKNHLFLVCYLDKRSKSVEEQRFVALLQNNFQFGFKRGFSGIKDGEFVCDSYEPSWRRKVTAPKHDPKPKKTETKRPKPISLD